MGGGGGGGRGREVCVCMCMCVYSNVCVCVGGGGVLFSLSLPRPLQVLVDEGYEEEDEVEVGVAFCGDRSQRNPTVIWSAGEGQPFRANAYTHVSLGHWGGAGIQRWRVLLHGCLDRSTYTQCYPLTFGA